MSVDLQAQLQRTLGDAYRLNREIGGGGMSRVFEAEEVRLKRKVAIKVLSPELAQELSVERFEREIQTAAALQQANIVPVLSAGDTDGLPFYTMPFVDGESLRTRLARGPLAVTEVVSVMKDVAKALAYAHRSGVVHRDIKPDNVLLSEGTAVVTDFGIAKAISAARTSAPDATLTQVGTSIGTPAYMAPEQAAGDPHIDHRADIYSLGAMGYELLAGQSVFAGRTPQRMMAAQMSETPQHIAELRPDMPATLAALVMQCLAKNADDRPQAAGEIVRQLETITSGSGLQAMPPVLLGGPGMFRKALAIYAVAFVAVAILAKAAIVGLGLPDWVFPGALGVMALVLPVVLWTGYVHRVTQRALTMTPTYTPGGTPSLNVSGTIATIALRAAPHVSWYRTARGGMYLVGGFVLAIAAFMAMRAYGVGPAGSLLASGKLGANDQILVADFKTSASDSALSGTLATLMSTSLSQSSAVRLVPSSTVSAALTRMQKPLDSRVDLALARELAAREGIKAIATGEITQLTGGYVVTAKLVAAANGDVLWQNSESIDGVKELTAAIDRLSRDLRGKIGESLKTVRADPPLAQVTTRSLEALRKYSEGSRAYNQEGDVPKAISLLEEAVTLDTAFGAAWRKLGGVVANTGQRSRLGTARELADRGVRFVDQMTEPERLDMLAFYYGNGTHRDRQKYLDTRLELVRRYPRFLSAPNNAGGVLYNVARDYAKAESLQILAIKETPDDRFGWGAVVPPQIALGKLDVARQSVAVGRQRFPAMAEDYDISDAMILYNQGRVDSAVAFLQRTARKPPSAAQRYARAGLAYHSLRSGRLTDFSASYSAVLREDAVTRSNPAPAIADSLLFLEVALRTNEPPAVVAARLDGLLGRLPLTSLALAQRPYFRVASLYAQAGRADRAQAILGEYDRAVTDTAQRRIDAPARRGVNGWIALAQNRPRDAVAEFREADRPPYATTAGCPMCWDPAIGRAFDAAQMPDSAIAVFEHFTHAPVSNKLFVEAPDLPWVIRRLGELYEQKGDIPKAVAYYRQYAEMWKNADPELQPRVAEVRKRIAKLTPLEPPKR